MELSVLKVKTMSSLEISELTGKEHSKVMSDIQRILEEVGIGTAEFRASYISQQNKELPCFRLPRRECDLIIAGYSAKYRLAIIDRWQELESRQVATLPDFTNPAIAARAWADEVEQKQIALAQIENDKPKVDFAMAVRNLQGSCSISDFAKTIGTGRNKLFERFREEGYLMRNNRPYQHYINEPRDFFVVVEGIPYTDGNGKTHPAFESRITGKGQVYFEKKFRDL